MQKSRFLIGALILLQAASVLNAQSLSAPAVTNVSFKGPGDVTLKAYLAVPSGKGPFPAVLLIHEWWGLTHNIRLLADALAAKGYVVLAADAFRGKVAGAPAEAGKLVQGTPAKQVAGDLDAAFAYLRKRPEVDPKRVAVFGFCYGGTQSMYMGTRNPELAAVIIFYGPGPITDTAQLGTMKQAGPLLGIYGEDDPNIPMKQVTAFDRALKDKGVEHTIIVYPGVGHAFVNAGNYNKSGTPQKAWNQMLDFLKHTIGKTAGMM